MAARLKDSWVRLFPLPGRAVQAVWLLFMLPAVSLALAGIAPFYQLLQTICTGEVCVNGQLTPAEAQVNLDFSASPITYADLALSVYLFTYLLIFLTAVTLIWLKPAHGAAVCGAFCLTALATGNLALAATQISFALLIPVQFIHWVQLATLLPFIALIPDGRFHPSWLQWVALAVIPVAFLVAFGLVGMNSAQLVGALIGLLIVSMEIARYRWLPASPQREQMVWAVTAVALLAGAQWMGRPVQLLPLPALPLGAITTAPFFYPIFGLLLLVGALACLMVALLGDELFRLEVALNRALVYSLLTLFVVGAYVLIVGYLSLLFRASDNLWLSLIATGLVAALFQPVRAWVQRFVNGMLYGARDTPYAVIAGLGRRLEAAFVPESILPTIAETVRESLQLPYVAIALEGVGAGDVAAEAGTSLGEPVAFPLNYQGVVIGRLLVSPRRGERELAAADRALLTDLARQAGVAIHGVRQTAEVKQLADSLQQARERLILAQEEERRRLRRDLHDDLAPTLVGLSLRASAISDLITSDPVKAGRLADFLDSAIRDSVTNIRRLVYDLRPPALDDLGLLAAVRERAIEYSHQGLSIVVLAPETLPPLPAAVEVAAYRIVQEGLLNVVKHAGAQSCSIHITNGEALVIEIVDDGAGLPETYRKGVGLGSIQERAAELGGVCRFVNGEWAGTHLTVRLPIT